MAGQSKPKRADGAAHPLSMSINQSAFSRRSESLETDLHRLRSTIWTDRTLTHGRCWMKETVASLRKVRHWTTLSDSDALNQRDPKLHGKPLPTGAQKVRFYREPVVRSLNPVISSNANALLSHSLLSNPFEEVLNDGIREHNVKGVVFEGQRGCVTKKRFDAIARLHFVFDVDERHAEIRLLKKPSIRPKMLSTTNIQNSHRVAKQA